MKSKRGLFFSLLGISFGLCLFSSIAKENKPKEVNAAYYQDKVIFIRNNSGQYDGWLTANAKLKINYQDSSDNWHNDVLKDVVSIANSSSYIYKYTLCSDVKKIQILRFDPTLNTQWNYSNSIENLDSSKNLFELSTLSDNAGFSYSSANINHLVSEQGKNGSVKIVVNNTDNDIGSDAYVYSDHWFELVGVPNPGYYLTEFSSNNSDNVTIRDNGKALLEGTKGDTIFSGIFLKERDIRIGENDLNAQYNSETKEFVASNVFIEKGQCIKGTYHGGGYNVFVEDHDRSFICNNGDEAICQFTGFYNLYLKSNDGGNNYPNIYIASQDKIDVERFVNEALLMNSYDTNRSGVGDGRCHTYYQYAINAYENMLTEYALYLFENEPEYEEARQRFDTWKQFNTTNPNSLFYNNKDNSVDFAEDDPVTLIMVMSVVTSVSLLGLCILKKKKHA